ncbi:YhjD/YihY/BrkB family envelope integrity protein [Streptomyces sp. NPDC058695]|uniref:YhjD/YihY/BrkB family envelope integrity protein n=1 Tax=Streptomyces sp. NPDC058695 TaxID=3346604 RepID=UPI0036469BDC
MRDDSARGGLTGTLAKVARWGAARAGELRERLPFITRLTRQMVDVSLLDSSTRLAAQAFLTAIPVLFVIAAFAPTAVRDRLIESATYALGLSGPALDQVRQVFGTPDDTARDTSGAVGVLVTLLSATSCSRALQRVCERSWHVRPAGLRLIAWRWLVWLLVWLSALMVQGLLSEGFGLGPWLGLPLSFASSTLLWWWTQHMLLGSRVPWLPLLPGAVLTGTGVVVLAWASRFYMPLTLNRSVSEFGPLGLVFTLLSWLIALFTVVCVGIATGYVLAHEPPLARRLGTPPPG